MKWQLLPSRNTSCFFAAVGIVAETPFSGSLFLWFTDTNELLLCDICWILHKAFWLFYSDRGLWLREVNLLLWLVWSTIQDQQRRECNKGKKTVFLLRCLCSSEHWELSDIENYTSMSNVLQQSQNESNVPKLFPVEQLHKWDSY